MLFFTSEMSKWVEFVYVDSMKLYKLHSSLQGKEEYGHMWTGYFQNK